jgi:hypothetical protein
VSLSLDPTFSILKDHFVVGWKNIAREDYVGSSHGYECNQPAVGTTNGAGPRNMQMFMLSPDGVVLHCLPGFWHPEDLAHELQMGRTLHRLWKDKRSTKAKRDMFKRIQMRTMRNLPKSMVSRSSWQGFDAANERDRLKKLKTGQTRDTFIYKDGKPTRIKPLTTVVHERMLKQPFVKFSRFDTEAFIDYGRNYYDNNMRVDSSGVRFGSKGYMASQKRMKKRAEKRAAQKKKVDEYYGKKPKKDDYKGRMKGKTMKPKAKAKKPKQKKRRPTSRPTSRPSRRRA